MGKLSGEELFKEVSDLGLVAYLVTRGYVPVQRNVIKNKFLSFRFKRTPELEEDCLNYYDKKTSADALSLIDNFKSIKAMARELGEVIP